MNVSQAVQRSGLGAVGKTAEPRTPKHEGSFTLIELIIGAAMLAIAITALLGAFLGQVTLNEHARNLTWAINDANRVMERLRQQHTTGGLGCPTPTVTLLPAECGGACANWDAWLINNGGKSIEPAGAPQYSLERIIVTPGGVPDPLQITVSVCWRHRNRTLGGCGWDGAILTDPGGVVQSPAMLSTLMTCRQ